MGPMGLGVTGVPVLSLVAMGPRAGHVSVQGWPLGVKTVKDHLMRSRSVSLCIVQVWFTWLKFQFLAYCFV